MQCHIRCEQLQKGIWCSVTRAKGKVNYMKKYMMGWRLLRYSITQEKEKVRNTETRVRETNANVQCSAKEKLTTRKCKGSEVGYKGEIYGHELCHEWNRKIIRRPETVRIRSNAKHFVFQAMINTSFKLG